MTKNIIVIILLLQVSGIVWSQKKIIIADHKTREIIPFATVLFSEGGDYTNEKGELIIPEKPGDSIFISHVGYNDYFDLVSNLKDSLFLVPLFFEMPEIKIGGEILDLSPLKKAKKWKSWPLHPKTELVIIVIPEDKIINSFIENVNFKISTKRDYASMTGKESLRVRLNIYKRENNQIAEKIYSGNPKLVNAGKSNLIEFDIKKERVILDDEGLCFGLELIEVMGNFENGYFRPLFTDKKSQYFAAYTFLNTHFKRNPQLNL